ncbi:CopD family protein [Legionella gresilensis]|uniref:CopD family protein n=1 Tax=Legionella gresilensis TaxID=91823 RepID=UPI001041BAA3|nr:CopD family protein [Legionella gresilensis]
MLWMLLLHISTLLGWCGSLLYLPGLIATASIQQGEVHSAYIHVPRKIFTHILTPTALIAVISGTIIFLKMKLIAAWLIMKLTLVSGLVICHVLNGWLILRLEKMPEKPRLLPCLIVGLISAILIIAILWLVLAKPYV